MRKEIRIALAFVVSVLWVAVAIASPNMHDGKWEITTKLDMKGLPMQMQPIKTTVCLDQKDAVPQKPQKNEDCKMISNKVEGNTVTWVMQCKDKNGTVDSTGKITYKGDSFDGTLNMTMSGKGGKQQMSQKMSGKRIGDCTK